MQRKMLLELSEFEKCPALYLYPRILISLVCKKNSSSQSDGISSQSDGISSAIPVVRLYDFSHPDKMPGKDCPFAIDGERYYFTRQVHRDASRKRSKRKAGEEGAYWKSTSTDIDIINLDKNLIGYMRKYTLYEDKDDTRSANWYMEEYRVHNHHELDDPYVLCKIYDRESVFSGHTEGSIRSLTNRAIKRKQGSQLDQTNSIFDNMSPSNSNLENPLQTQFDNNNFGEAFVMLPTLPTSESFPLDSSLLIHRPPGYSNGFSTSHDASGNQNRPESVPPIPRNSILMNQSQTQFDNNNFAEDLTMQQTSLENFLFKSTPCPIPYKSPYSNESLHVIDESFSGPSMTHYLFENPSAPDGEESPLDLWNHSNFQDKME